MRYYVPLREKKVPDKKPSPSQLVPLWIWLAIIAVLMLFILALR